LDRLKKEGLPLVPRTDTSANGVARQAKRNPDELLLAEPSPEAVQAAEESFVSGRELVTDSNVLQRLRVRKESVELQDFFTDRAQRQLQREIDDERREQERESEDLLRRRAELAHEQHQRFLERWFGYAVEQKPRNGPDDFALVIQAEVLAALTSVQPGQKDSTVQALVDAAVVRSLQPWRAAEKKREANRDALNRALCSLPLEMRWDDEWAARATQAASNAIDGAREDATTSHLAAIAVAALLPLIPQFQHQEKIKEAIEALQFVSVPGAEWQEQEEAKAAAQRALSDLPLGGASDQAIKRSVNDALAPIRESVAARLDKTERSRILNGIELHLPWGLPAAEKQSALTEAAAAIAQLPAGSSTTDLERARNRVVDRYEAKLSLITRRLAEILPHAEWMLKNFDGFDGETAWSLQARVKDQVEKTLWKELTGAEDDDFVVDRVHEIMEEDCN
jgi:hypothetical protein